MREIGRVFYLIVAVTAAIVLSGCAVGTGTVTVNLTDAPVDDESVESVFITVTGIAYHIGDTAEFSEVPDFGEPKKVDLLALTGGAFESLGDFQFPAGKITQIRFFLDAPETGSVAPANPGCYIKLVGDEENYPLFVPSGSESGFKATGSFDVPLNGAIAVTADFDVRKSVTRINNSSYRLRPTIRTIVSDEAGKINGSLAYDGAENIIIFAYEDGGYGTSETESDPPFSGAVTSAVVDDDHSFSLPFLAAGMYDLVYLEIDGDGGYLVSGLSISEDVTVESGKTTAVNLAF